MSPRKRPLFVVRILSSFCLLLVACQSRSDIARPAVPEALRAAPELKVTLKAHATGFQIYDCRAKANDPKAFEWQLKAPEAELSDEQGHTLKHYAGPTWEASDGSKIVGALKAKADASDPNAIPWLLLDVKSSEGSGVLHGVKSVQRVDTVGGKAAPAGCDAEHVASEQRVPYQANYYFLSE